MISLINRYTCWLKMMGLHFYFWNIFSPNKNIVFSHHILERYSVSLTTVQCFKEWFGRRVLDWYMLIKNDGDTLLFFKYTFSTHFRFLVWQLSTITKTDIVFLSIHLLLTFANYYTFMYIINVIISFRTHLICSEIRQFSM